MPAYSWKKAKACNALNEADTDCLLAMFLISVDQIKTDGKLYEQVAAELDTKKARMSDKMYRIYKKLKDSDCVLESEGEVVATVQKKVGSKKRKADSNDEVLEPEKAKKKVARGKKISKNMDDENELGDIEAKVEDEDEV